MYMDPDAAIKINGNSTKKNLLPDESPFCKLFDYGAQAEGYWTYDHMVLQMEDCIDVLDALFSRRCTPNSHNPHNQFVPNTATPNSLVRLFDYVYVVDHSNGHDRKRPDGLDIFGLRRGPTSKSKRMRSVKIEKEDSILSSNYNHSLKLQINDTQKMVFGELNNFGDKERGPFYLSEEDCINFKYDVMGDKEEVKKGKHELQNDLREKGIYADGVKEDLVTRCIANGIPIKKHNKRF